MDKFIVGAFPNERSAYAFLTSLQDLDLNGSIELFATEVITKDQSGQLIQKASDNQQGLGTVVGSSVGALLGLLGGPVGGAVGAVAGGAAGLAGESAYSGVSGEFLSNATRSLAPGRYAVFAEAYEDWTFPIDDAARAQGGQVHRQATGDVVKAQMKAEDDAARDEMAQLDAEIARSSGEAKAKLESQRGEAKAKYARRSEQQKQRLEQMQKTWDAKVASVQQKAEKAASDAKSRHQAVAQKMSNYVKREKESLKQMFS